MSAKNPLNGASSASEKEHLYKVSQVLYRQLNYLQLEYTL